MTFKGYAKELHEALLHKLGCKIVRANCLACRDAEHLAAIGRMIDCPRCEGEGEIQTNCHDPQCGDSTWDHNCGDGYRECPKCHGQKTVSSLELMAEKSEATVS